MKYVSRKILYSILFAVLVYAGLAVFSDLGKVSGSVYRFRFVFLIPVLGLSLGNYLIRFFRWDGFIRSVGVRLQRPESFRIFMAGLFMSISPGKVGELIKSWLLKDYHGVPVSVSSPVVVSERVTDFTAIILLTLAGLSLYRQALYWVMAGAAFIGIFALVFYSEWLFSIVYSLCGKLRLPAVLMEFVVQMRETMKSFLKPYPLMFGTLLGVFAWGCECLGLYLVLAGFGIPISLPQAVFAYSAATLVGALSFLPGGLGATEVSLAALLIRFGVVKGDAASATVLVRLATLWFAVALGGIFLYRFVRERPAGEVVD